MKHLQSYRSLAPAKVNLHLEIGKLLANGLHKISSIFQQLSFGDLVELQVFKRAALPNKSDNIEIQGNFNFAAGHNLAYKAAKVFLTRLPAPLRSNLHFIIKIIKKIPSQAGFGGGSSDAATVLRLLNKHFKDVFSRQELLELATSIGSDVPFFLLGGTCFVTGNGERIFKLRRLLPYKFFLFKLLDTSASTKELFQDLDSYRLRKGLQSPELSRRTESARAKDFSQTLASTNPKNWPFFNSFTPIILEKHLPLVEKIQSFYNNGSLFTEITGSGTALFALFRHDASLLELYDTCRGAQQWAVICELANELPPVYGV